MCVSRLGYKYVELFYNLQIFVEVIEKKKIRNKVRISDAKLPSYREKFLC
jgi:hypothetical protein